MKNEFVPYELAVKLKALGFDEPCFARFNNDGDLLIAHTEKYIIDNGVDRSEFFTLAPLFQQAFRWFREKHQLDTSINTVYSKYNDALSKKYSGVIDDKSVFTNIGFYDAYEEAELACLDKLIEIATKQ